MRKSLLFAALLSLAACQKEGASSSSGGATASAGAPQTEDQKTLYAIGLVEARRLGVFNLTKEELAQVQQGLSDGVTGAKPQVELETYGPKINQLAQARMGAKSETEKKKGQDYLAQHANDQGAQKTESGALYIEKQAGSGAQPAVSDTVKVHYKGTLIDGTEFDSSYKRGQPAEFPLQAVIKCWTEGVAKMKVGGKAQLVCPSDVAYGDQGRPPQIPGGATLLFDVELVDITTPKAEPTGAAGKPGTKAPAAPKAAPKPATK
ncbi:FKBP-type peptidyl-prolyl cis-trans isomerase [Aggregicoccus sp. 17bor-14]|uniref:FKBP-type peptidyl-prolyl cis-trans isomerase n=1 Tax=Myxococcaceae TaxID=31 RepID=UPI00129CD4FB|nr:MULTISPECIES: FKBP-type peptidyl-prolyl cis-trans isomerase [Myxococcaceae]MBF5044642.1 FKBP-type peptidyl-prolyl cis-trans isomerase [Simulacricoccus sp. 17bor-14]MRI90386.1 FKBP-type peptidyl-prolyl cis-trans isomerase [Aggregicoccus sp. 17bor-14]